ncbi:MAG: hypothetical protein WD794_03835 [Mycobacteriales bacterium]
MSHRVVLVRDPRAGPAGAGCCSGDIRPFDEGGSHRHVPRQDPVGAVYRALRDALPADVSLEVVSPSNWLWLVPTLVADGRRLGLRGMPLFGAVRSGLVVSSLIVDGRVLFSGRLPPPQAAVAAVRTELESPGANCPARGRTSPDRLPTRRFSRAAARPRRPGRRRPRPRLHLP